MGAANRHMLEFGGVLLEAEELVERGQKGAFLAWIRQETGVNETTASDAMRICRWTRDKFGDAPQVLDELCQAPFQTLRSLPGKSQHDQAKILARFVPPAGTVARRLPQLSVTVEGAEDQPGSSSAGSRGQGSDWLTQVMARLDKAISSGAAEQASYERVKEAVQECIEAYRPEHRGYPAGQLAGFFHASRVGASEPDMHSDRLGLLVSLPVPIAFFALLCWLRWRTGGDRDAEWSEQHG